MKEPRKLLPRLILRSCVTPPRLSSRKCKESRKPSTEQEWADFIAARGDKTYGGHEGGLGMNKQAMHQIASGEYVGVPQIIINEHLAAFGEPTVSRVLPTPPGSGLRREAKVRVQNLIEDAAKYNGRIGHVLGRYEENSGEELWRVLLEEANPMTLVIPPDAIQLLN